MRKKVSKKKIGIISSVIIAICIVGGITLANANQEEEFVEPLREYPVSRGDIIAGFTGAGQLKLNTKDYNFSQPVTIEEIFVKVGQEIKAGDPLAKISDESIQKQLDDLNEQLTKANMSLDQANNAKQLNILNNEKSWNQSIQTIQEQYNNEKNSIESEIKKLDEQLANIQTQTHTTKNKISELEAIKEQQLSEILEGDLEESPQTENESSENSGINTMSIDPGVQQELEQLYQQLAELEQQEASVRTQINDALIRKNELNGRHEQELQKQNQEVASNKEINDKTLQDLDASIKLATMEVEKIKKEISEIKTLSENNILVADVDGIVKEVGYTPNTLTSTDKAIVTVGTLETITAELSVSQNDVTKLEEGQVVHLEVNAFPGEKLMAKVKSINYMPTSEGGTVLYKVQVELEPTDRNLLEGMTVNAKFIIKEVKDVLTLSNKAITLKDGKQMVQVKREDGTIEEVEIMTGFSDGRVSEIKDGLNEGDVVVVGG